MRMLHMKSLYLTYSYLGSMEEGLSGRLEKRGSGIENVPWKE